MSDFIPIDGHVYRTKLDTSGRMVLPQPIREQLHLSAGDEVLLVPLQSCLSRTTRAELVLRRRIKVAFEDSESTKPCRSPIPKRCDLFGI